jgi:prevent-host-death family protein
MKFANTVELKNKTNALLRLVMGGEPVIITYRGKPAAALTPLGEDDLEDFVLAYSPRIGKKLAEAEAAREAGDVIPLEDYLKRSEESGG